MIAAALLFTASALLRKQPSFLQKDFAVFGLDPHCAEGISDTTLTYCCSKDCGECGDGSPTCVNKATNGQGSTCCPTDMTEQPSCDVSKAPCLIPAYIRADTTASDMGSAAGVHNAGQDCNQAKPDEAARSLLATHFVKFDNKEPLSATTTDCSARAMELAAAKCDKDNTCLGMTTNSDGSFDCFLVAGSEVTALRDGSTSTYLKKEGSAGQTFTYQGSAYVQDAACKAFCGQHAEDNADDGNAPTDSTMTRTITCMSSQGETMALGMCSLTGAMAQAADPDASGFPTTSIACSCH